MHKNVITTEYLTTTHCKQYNINTVHNTYFLSDAFYAKLLHEGRELYCGGLADYNLKHLLANGADLAGLGVACPVCDQYHIIIIII